MEDQKAIALFREISEKTESRRINWEPTADEDEFVASVGGKFTILIRAYSYIDDRGDKSGSPTLILKDANDRELVQVGFGLEGLSGEELRGLYEKVRRQALRVEERLDEVLTELEKL